MRPAPSKGLRDCDQEGLTAIGVDRRVVGRDMHHTIEARRHRAGPGIGNRLERVVIGDYQFWPVPESSPLLR